MAETIQNPMSWGIIGAGNIGSRVLEQLANPEISQRLGLSPTPDYVLRQRGLYMSGSAVPTDYHGDYPLPEVGVLFVATSGMQGKENPVYQNVTHNLNSGRIVVTAEKGTVAEHYQELKNRSNGFSRFGMNATVGGGTRLMGVFGEYNIDVPNINQAHFALNGTLAYILGQVSSGVSAGEAVDEAIKLGFAEPGADTLEEVMAGEATGDIPKKLAIVLNTLFLPEYEYVSAIDFAFSLTDKDVRRAFKEALTRRFIVSIYNQDQQGFDAEEHAENVIGGFSKIVGQWFVVAGFADVTKNPNTSLFASQHGAKAGFVVGLGPNNQDGSYQLFGPGAGPKPTANTMLDDAARLIRQRHIR